MLTKLLLVFGLLILGQTYDIVTSCGSGCRSGCRQCITQSGGPFDQYQCIDPIGVTCKDLFGLQQIKQVLSFVCGGCNNGKQCSYSDSLNGIVLGSGCTNDTDANWPDLKANLDVAYKKLNPTAGPFDWCGYDCTSGQSGLSTGILIGIIAGGVVVVAIAIVVIVKFCKGKKV